MLKFKDIFSYDYPKQKQKKPECNTNYYIQTVTSFNSILILEADLILEKSLKYPAAKIY